MLAVIITEVRILSLSQSEDQSPIRSFMFLERTIHVELECQENFVLQETVCPEDI